MLPAIPAGAQTPGGQALENCTGYSYVVRRGDTWGLVAHRTGIPAASIKASNPRAAGRPNGWLYIGEVLCIPDASSGKPAAGYWYHVLEGDTWNTVARKTGVPVRDLWRANARLLDHNLWLYVGQRVWVPRATGQTPTAAPSPAALPPSATPVASPEPAGVITATVVVTVVVTATPEAAALPPLSPSPAATATATATATAAVPTATATAVASAAPTTRSRTPVAATPTPVTPPRATDTSATPTRAAAALRVPVPGCPADLDAYATEILRRLNGSTITPGGLEGWLEACNAIDGEGGGVVPVTLARGEDDALVVVLNPPGELPLGAALLVYRSGQNGMMQVYRADSRASVELLKAGDLNEDERVDLLWVERSCGANTCFDTLHVDSWDADAETFEDWLASEPEMAYAEISVDETSADGQGLEIVLAGGEMGSAGAGPQRGREEVYGSPDGGPYTLLDQQYESSQCIYHAILDANELFNDWEREGFEPAIVAYRDIVNDQALTECSDGRIEDEAATLRDFARYRLMVSYVALGRASSAQPLLGQIKHRALYGAADTFLKSYRANTSVIQACRDTTKYARATPDSWQFLNDWGYANPGFEATELCPVR